MWYFMYGFVSIIEAAIVYALGMLILGFFGVKIPAIGSQAFIVFILLWPFLGPLFRPGLYSIPIIGSILALLHSVTVGGKEG